MGYYEGKTSNSSYQNPEGTGGAKGSAQSSEILQRPAKNKSEKRVKWNNQLEEVKYFKQNDEPSAAGLTI